MRWLFCVQGLPFGEWSLRASLLNVITAQSAVTLARLHGEGAIGEVEYNAFVEGLGLFGVFEVGLIQFGEGKEGVVEADAFVEAVDDGLVHGSGLGVLTLLLVDLSLDVEDVVLEGVIGEDSGDGVHLGECGVKLVLEEE